MTTPRIAIFGAGLIGQKHAQLVADAGHLSAIVDPSPTAAPLAEQLNCQYFASPEECLTGAAVDGVIIATPNQLHVSHADLCLSHGLPMMIEKPIADLSTEAQALVNRAEAQGVPILVAHHRRHNPIAIATRNAIQDGKLGKIAAISGHFLLYKPDDYFDQPWRSKEGAGPVYINLIHDIDLLRFFCGEVVEVQAMQSSAARGFEVEDTAAILLRFDSGALGTFIVSDTVAAPWSWEFSAAENPAYPHLDVGAYHIAGTHGALSVPDMRMWHHPDERSWWQPMQETRLGYEADDPFERQYRHFLDVCGGAEPIVSGREGLESLKVIEAIKHAAKRA